MHSSHKNLAVTIGKNTLFGVISRVAQVATRLVTIPVVVAHLGLGGYGIWSIIMTTAAYMRFGSVGIKSAFQKYVAEATGSGDYETANKLLSTGTAAMLVLSVAGLIPAALFSKQIAVASGVPAEFLTSSARAIGVLALIMAMSNMGAAYEAIVMGAHRIDLARTFTTIFTVLEAVAIVIVLHFGYGLFAMALIMAASEAGFVVSCYIAAKRVAPEVHMARKYVTKTVAYELFRFAGSYQLVNVLEVLYGAILPIAVLRNFGADASGVYALAARLVGAAMMLPDAFLLPILSGGTMVYASGSVEGINLLIRKAFKVTLVLSLFPLGFIALFGTTIIYAWTGQSDPTLGVALSLTALATLFASFSMLGLVLYRVSGHAILDNIRQVMRIVVLFSIALFSYKVGFYGVLSGLAAAEFVGMVFMIYAIVKTFPAFHATTLLPDAVKLGLSTAAMLAAGLLATRLHLPAFSNMRINDLADLSKIFLACLLAAPPALLLTKAVTGAESRALLGIVFPRWARPAQGLTAGAN